MANRKRKINEILEIGKEAVTGIMLSNLLMKRYTILLRELNDCNIRIYLACYGISGIFHSIGWRNSGNPTSPYSDTFRLYALQLYRRCCRMSKAVLVTAQTGAKLIHSVVCLTKIP
jgi:hypothetical protein